MRVSLKKKRILTWVENHFSFAAQNYSLLLTIIVSV